MNVQINSNFSEDMMSGMDIADIAERARIAETMKYGIIIISELPLLCVYPFIQKYFVKGVMIGTVKC